MCFSPFQPSISFLNIIYLTPKSGRKEEKENDLSLSRLHHRVLLIIAKIFLSFLVMKQYSFFAINFFFFPPFYYFSFLTLFYYTIIYTSLFLIYFRVLHCERPLCPPGGITRAA